jgi:hypothetical protein
MSEAIRCTFILQLASFFTNLESGDVLRGKDLANDLFILPIAFE